ncbi:hypothetical protein XENOCAPTIV_016016 [Xenoophorus captivus]|uniref:DUF7030 domain-containing protein n=1 Tax=Xenoophorus captivus TaxID=1517983 RepID=A0ABV0R0M6_9TELE
MLLVEFRSKLKNRGSRPCWEVFRRGFDQQKAMAVEARPELVGKRFLCVSGDEPPENGDIVRLPWRSGVIRAVSNGDSANSDLTVRSVVIFLLPCGVLHGKQVGKSVDVG